jgi:hypothetical protein
LAGSRSRAQATPRPVSGAGTLTLGALAVAGPTAEWAVGAQQDATTGNSSFRAFRIA